MLKKGIGILILTTVFSSNVASTALAAGIWSEPVTTEIWSEPTETEIWSEPTDIGVALTFTVLPVIENGSVLVPIRGTLEQLGFSIEWIAKEKLVVVKKDGTVIRLQADATTATIDGKNVTLNSPAKIINGSVFVPLRFISQATGSKVEWEAATRKVTIDDKYYFYVNNTQQQPNNQSSNQQAQVQSGFYTGVWEIWVPGGYGSIGSTLNGDGSTTVYQEYVPGSNGKTITIKSDGTYTWEVVGGTVNGVWATADKGRIVLTKGQYEYDWYVEKVDQNQIKLYAWGMEEYGKKIR